MEELDTKSRNRWKMTIWVLGYLAVFGVGLFAMAYADKVEGVKALVPLAYAMLGFAAALLGVNLVSPAGGMGKGK